MILLLSVASGRAANIIRPQHTTAQAMVQHKSRKTWCMKESDLFKQLTKLTSLEGEQ